MSTPLETKIVSQAPPFALIGENLSDYTIATIHGFRIGAQAVVDINPEALQQRPATLELDKKTLTIAQLASLAIPQTTISKGFDKPVGNVGHHVSLALTAFEARHRNATALSRAMWDIGYYCVAKSAEPLGLSAQEAEAVDLLSQGFIMKEIDEQLRPKYGEKHRSMRSLLRSIGNFSGWDQADAVAWRAMVGGDIATHAPATPSGW